MRPDTWSDENGGSAVFVIATPTPVREEVYIRELGGWTWVDQVLDIAGMTDEQVAACRGMSVLNSHRRWDVRDDILGSVVEVWREDIPNVGLSLLGRIQIDPTEPKVAAKVKSGSIRQVSAGFKYLDGATIQMREGNVPLMLQPALFRETSFVAVGADPNAHARSDEPRERTTSIPTVRSITSTQGTTMDLDAIRTATAGLASAVAALQTAVTNTPASPPATGTRAASDPVDQAGQDAIEGRRSAPVQTTTQAAPTAPAAPATGQRSAADQAAIMGLRSIAKDAGKEAQFDAFVAAGETLEGLRSLARGYCETRSPETNGTTAGSDGQRSAEQFISFDEAVAGRRSGGGDVAALAQALAGVLGR